jgi:predicted MPP superfamily phosphohydrolase
MRYPTKSVMLDAKSRSRKGTAWKWTASVILVLGIYVLIRNYVYISQGMLEPNFRLIHKAYDFNFLELPLTLLGAAFLLAGGAVVWQEARRSLFFIAVLFAFFAIDLFALRYYITFVEPQELAVHHVLLETSKLKKSVRVLHISDIQSGGITEYERHMFERIRELKPDLILNTGDFLQVVPPATFESEFPKLLKLIEAVNPRFGTYAVFGDTERELYRIDPERLLPLRMLSSQSAKIDTGGGEIHLYGLSLYQSRNQDWAIRAVDEWLAQTEGDEFRILFGHAPDFALGMQDKLIDLCLAGHTHGGQVRLPWYGPLVIDSKVPEEWARGFRNIGIPYLNVSAGAGSNRYNGLPPIRLNCPTEITLIELVPLSFR